MLPAQLVIVLLTTVGRIGVLPDGPVAESALFGMLLLKDGSCTMAAIGGGADSSTGLDKKSNALTGSGQPLAEPA